MTIEIDKNVRSSDSETFKHLIGFVKGRILTGMGQKGSRSKADTGGSGDGVTGRPTLRRQMTVEIDHGFVKTRIGLLMAVQVYF